MSDELLQAMCEAYWKAAPGITNSMRAVLGVLHANGYRRCAEGQGVTQWCAAWEQADKACRDLTEKVIPNIRERAEKAEAERDALERANAELTVEISRLYACRDELQEVEAAKKHLADAERLRADRAEAAKDGAYFERNQCVALIARMAMALGYSAGTAKTAIEGWSEDWHGCTYIDLPAGQVSWHYHDSQSYLFDWLPPYCGEWDGHDTPEKYCRVLSRAPMPNARAEKAEAERDALRAEVERLRDSLARARLDAFREIHTARGES